VDQALLIAHFIGLALVAAAFLPLLGLMGQGAPMQTNRLLTQFGHWGIIVLLVSGPILLFSRYGGVDGVSHWFWAKMAMVGLLAAGVVTSAISARKMRAGDLAAAARMRLGRVVAVASLLAIVVFAVLAFN
jgi:protoporphyrinogen IX oxidase